MLLKLDTVDSFPWDNKQSDDHMIKENNKQETCYAHGSALRLLRSKKTTFHTNSRTDAHADNNNDM